MDLINYWILKYYANFERTYKYDVIARYAIILNLSRDIVVNSLIFIF